MQYTSLTHVSASETVVPFLALRDWMAIPLNLDAWLGT